MSNISINLKDLKNYNDICIIMRKNGINRYNYAFVEITTGEVVKHGLSAESNARDGDRIYRQAGHLEGWGKSRLRGPNGAEMRIAADEFQQRHGFPLFRQHVRIDIIDMTGATDIEIKELERKMINETVDRTGGIPPVGNKDSETMAYAKRVRGEKNLSRMFDYA